LRQLRPVGTASHTIGGRVAVHDESGLPLSAALVVGRWTQPDGSVRDEMAWTRGDGVAAFTTTGPTGSYTLAVVNIVLSLHTFDPSHSVLQQSITVTR
jgi:hypothetical protein